MSFGMRVGSAAASAWSEYFSLASGGAATFAAGPTINASISNLGLRIQYPTDPNYRLDINQIVTSGLVKHSFNVVNAGTSYNNNLVLDRGNVGIGTTSPSEKVEVSGSGNQYIKITATDGSNAGIKMNSVGQREYGIFSDGALRFYDFTASTDRMRITSAGYVGINSTSPISQLSVKGVGGATGVTLTLENGGGIAALNDPLGIIDFYSNDPSVGASGIHGSLSVRNEFNGNWDGTPGRQNTYMSFSTAASKVVSEKVRITSAGNVGIGTTSPSAKLEVAGNIYANESSATAISVYNSGSIRAKMSMTGNEGDLTLYGSSATAKVYLSAYYASYFNAGNVLIGTTTDAGYKLDVNGASRIKSTTQYGLSISQSKTQEDFADALYLENTLSGQRVQIGMATNDSDGQHHRVSLRAYKGSGTYEGVFGIVMRQASVSTHVQRLTLTAAGNLSVDGSMTATSFFESSDKTIKTLIQDNYQTKGIESVTAKLYTKNGKEELGYYAQDLQDILPSAVSKGDNGLLNLSYREVHTAKISSLEHIVKEQQAQIQELKELVNQLSNK
jgi:hypothetical protein